MRYVSIFFAVLCLAVSMAAQSGRVKPPESPTPTPVARKAIVYLPTQEKAEPTPTPDPQKTADDPDVIKVDAALVPIPVTVVDASGRTVTDLKLADFELRVDGKLVEITDISRSETPIRLAMLFDNSSSVFIAREFEKDAAIKFFRRVIDPKRDLAALFSFSDYIRLEQPLTRDISQLTAAIAMFPEPKGATALLDGIIEVAEYLRSAQGRRVIVIVSDGEDTYSDFKNTLEVVARSLQVNDCQVYVVKTKEFENFKRTGIRGGNANIRTLTAEHRMLELAAQTGGAVYAPIDENELNEAFKKITAELAQQYILNYYPDNETEKRGEFRNITVSVKTRSNLLARTRKGYFVPAK